MRDWKNATSFNIWIAVHLDGVLVTLQVFKINIPTHVYLFGAFLLIVPLSQSLTNDKIDQ